MTASKTKPCSARHQWTLFMNAHNVWGACNVRREIYHCISVQFDRVAILRHQLQVVFCIKYELPCGDQCSCSTCFSSPVHPASRVRRMKQACQH